MPENFASIIYTDRSGRHDMNPFGETDMLGVNQPSKGKSNRKKSNQKQAKANSADQMKKQAIADKRAAGKQKEPPVTENRGTDYLPKITWR